jgi:hypothetical protein
MVDTPDRMSFRQEGEAFRIPGPRNLASAYGVLLCSMQSDHIVVKTVYDLRSPFLATRLSYLKLSRCSAGG